MTMAPGQVDVDLLPAILDALASIDARLERLEALATEAHADLTAFRQGGLVGMMRRSR